MQGYAGLLGLLGLPGDPQRYSDPEAYSLGLLGLFMPKPPPFLDDFFNCSWLVLLSGRRLLWLFGLSYAAFLVDKYKNFLIIFNCFLRHMRVAGTLER